MFVRSSLDVEGSRSQLPSTGSSIRISAVGPNVDIQARQSSHQLTVYALDAAHGEHFVNK